MPIDKLTAASLIMATALPIANDFSTPFIGVPLTTIAGAVLGTYAAIAYDDVERPRGKLFSRAIATTILAASLAGVVPRWLGWAWANGVESAVAVMAAMLIYFIMEPVIHRARELIAGFRLTDFAIFRRSPVDTPPIDPQPPHEGGDDK